MQSVSTNNLWTVLSVYTSQVPIQWTKPKCRYFFILKGDKKVAKKGMLSVSTTTKWTVCIHASSNASVAKLLSGVDNSLAMCRGQFNSTSKADEWTECPASRERGSWGKNTKNICWAPSKTLNWSNLVDQSLQRELNRLKRLNSNWNWQKLWIVF